MSRKWLIKLHFLPNLKLMLKLLKLDKQPLLPLLSRPRLRDKKFRTRSKLSKNKERLMNKESHRQSNVLSRPPTLRLLLPIRLRISKLKLLLPKQDPWLTLRLPRPLS